MVFWERDASLVRMRGYAGVDVDRPRPRIVAFSVLCGNLPEPPVLFAPKSAGGSYSAVEVKQTGQVIYPTTHPFSFCILALAVYQPGQDRCR